MKHLHGLDLAESAPVHEGTGEAVEEVLAEDDRRDRELDVCRIIATVSIANVKKYAFRFSGLPRTSYASCTRRKIWRSSGVGLVSLSGWYFSTSLR